MHRRERTGARSARCPPHESYEGFHRTGWARLRDVERARRFQRRHARRPSLANWFTCASRLACLVTTLVLSALGRRCPPPGCRATSRRARTTTISSTSASSCATSTGTRPRSTGAWPPRSWPGVPGSTRSFSTPRRGSLFDEAHRRERRARCAPRAHGDTLVVHLAKRAALRRHHALHARLSRPRSSNGHGLTFIDADGGRTGRSSSGARARPPATATGSPPTNSRTTRMTWEVLATVPARFTAVSNGRLVSDVRNKDGSHTTHWSQEQPSATYLISLIVAPFARIHDQWRGHARRLLCVPRGQRARAPALRATRPT